MDKKAQRLLKKVYGKRPARVIPPLIDEERIGDVDGEYFTLYGFLPERFNDWEDDEIREYLDEYMVEEIRSPYDCTGKRFTRWYTFHRNPCGRISCIHRMGIDV